MLRPLHEDNNAFIGIILLLILIIAVIVVLILFVQLLVIVVIIAGLGIMAYLVYRLAPMPYKLYVPIALIIMIIGVCLMFFLGAIPSLQYA